MSATDQTPCAMSSLPPTTIAIVGGGMVGLSLSLLLAKSLPTAEITLLESLPFPARSESELPLYQPSFDARTSALAYGSRSLLELMGVWPLLAGHVTAVDTVHVSDKGHVGGCKMSARQYQVPALGYVVDNAWLGACLLEAAQGQANINIVAPAEVLSLQAIRQGYRLELKSESVERVIEANLAVIADGAQSSLRQSLGISVEQKRYAETAIIANVEFTQSHQGVAFERFTAEGPAAILPRGESASAKLGGLIWTHPHDQAQALAEQEPKIFLEQLQRAFGNRLGRFIRVGERHTYPLQLTKACEQIRPHLVVMGNAAHALHPVAGQGFNLSLRDCARLAEVLGGVKPTDTFGHLHQLQNYLNAQQCDQWLTVHFSDVLPQLFSSGRVAQAAGRGLGLWSLELIPQAKSQLARQSMGTRGRGFSQLINRSVV